MLDATLPPQYLAGLTLFRDHADPRRRYVLATTPRVVDDPSLQLSLLLFRGAQEGGLLQLEARLAPTAEQLAQAEAALEQAEGIRPLLVRPDWRAGTVRLAGWLQADELAPRTLFVGAPSLLGDPSAVIAARLDAASQPALAESALRGDALPTALIFELETLGLAGPLGIEVEADLAALHERLTAEGALTTPYGRARLAKTWEDALRENLIRVRVVDESGETETQRAEAMRRVGEDLIARMFSPMPPAERATLLEDGSVAPFELSFRLTARRETLETQARWSFRERRAVPVRHHAGANLIDLLGWHRPSDVIRRADLETGEAELCVRIEPELAALGLSALEIELRRDGEDRPSNALVLDDTQPERRLPLDPADTRALQFRARARFDPLRTTAPDRDSDWHDAAGRLVLVSARRLFSPRRFIAIAGRIDFDGIDHVELQLQAPGERPRSLQLRADVPMAEAFLPGAGDAPLVLAVQWHGADGEPSWSEPPREVVDDTLVVDSPFGEAVRVLLVPLWPTGIATLAVELQGDDPALPQTRTVAWDAPDRSPRTVALRRLADAPRSHRHRVQLVHDDGTMHEQPWRHGEATTLIVGPDPDDGAARARSTEVVVLGGGPAGRGALAIELRLQSGESVDRVLLEGDADHATLALLLPAAADDPATVALHMREFTFDGTVNETHWDDPPALVVVSPAHPDRFLTPPARTPCFTTNPCCSTAA